MPEIVRANVAIPADAHSSLKSTAALQRVSVKALLPAVLILATQDPSLIERAIPLARELEAQGQPWESRRPGRKSA